MTWREQRKSEAETSTTLKLNLSNKATLMVSHRPSSRRSLLTSKPSPRKNSQIRMSGQDIYFLFPMLWRMTVSLCCYSVHSASTICFLDGFIVWGFRLTIQCGVLGCFCFLAFSFLPFVYMRIKGVHVGQRVVFCFLSGRRRGVGGHCFLLLLLLA